MNYHFGTGSLLTRDGIEIGKLSELTIHNPESLDLTDQEFYTTGAFTIQVPAAWCQSVIDKLNRRALRYSRALKPAKYQHLIRRLAR
jgi:hypothetical protein